MDSILHIDLLIQPDREGTYFTLPFQLDREAASLTITYHYDRYANIVQPAQNGEYHAQPEINIIDLGLIAPDGSQVGASGSDKTEIQISETHATPGYNPCRLMPGEWQILVGAYKVAPEGCRVSYDIRWTSKEMQLLKGDLHVHTVASDGVCTPAELGQRVVRHGMDFLAITDHNQMIARAALPQIPGLTMIPGIEWTHYQGHANFLGIDQPYDEPFATNTVEDALARFQSAPPRGLLIQLITPWTITCGFQFDLNTFPFDCLKSGTAPCGNPTCGRLVCGRACYRLAGRYPSAAAAITTATPHSSFPADAPPASTPCPPASAISWMPCAKGMGILYSRPMVQPSP